MNATAPPQHRPRKGVLLTLAALAALIAGLAVCEYQGWPFLKGPLERGLSQRLDRRIDLGERFALHLWGAIRLSTNALTFGGLPSGPNLLESRNAQLELPYGTVFQLLRSNRQEPLRITLLDVEGLNVSLTRDAHGVANWHLTPEPTTSSSAPAMDMPRFGKLLVKAGHVQMHDELLKLQLDAQVNTAEGDLIVGSTDPNVQGGLVVTGQGHYRKKPFELSIKSGGILPLAAASTGPLTVPIAIKASAGPSRFSFTGQGTGLLTLSDLDGTLTLSGPSMATVGDAVGVTLPTTTLFSLKGRLGKTGEVWSLRQADLRVGTSKLGGAFTFDRRTSVPMLSGELTGSRFVLSDLAPAFGAQAPGANNPPPPEGRVLPQRSFDIPSLHAMNAKLKVKLQSVELGSVFAQALEPLDGDLTLQSGVLTITNLLAQTADGQVSGQLKLNANPQPPVWDANVHWKGIKLEQWLSPRNGFARQDANTSGKTAQAAAAAKDTSQRYVTGQLGGHAQLHGQGNSAAQMLGSMDGEAQAWVQNGQVSHLIVEAVGLDVAQALGVIIAGDKLLPMRCAVVRMKAQHGELKPEVAIVDTTDSTLLASGSMSLVSEKLDLLMTAKPKDISPLTLRSPVTLEGTFAAPKIGLKAKPLGTKVLAAVALGFVNPLASLIPFIDVGERGDGGCQQALHHLKGDRPQPLALQ
jgi:uncharacterized protein involved in outer membrane biogenesis